MIHKLETTLILPVHISKAWSFFSSPHNLNQITPPDMHFKILSDLNEKMYQGMFINYRIKPMFNVWVNWCTEITHVSEGRYFVDEQRKGPYKIWHHEHHFKEINNGVEMRDILHYDIGMGPLGYLAGKIFVHKKVNQIFEFRKQKLIEIFGSL